MLKGGGVMLVRPRVPHTKLVMAAPSLSGLTACMAATHCSYTQVIQVVLLQFASCNVSGDAVSREHVYIKAGTHSSHKCG